jgi:hypothetical protein
MRFLNLNERPVMKNFSRISMYGLLEGALTLSLFAVNPNGTWVGQVTAGDHPYAVTLSLKADGSVLAGTLTGGPPTGKEVQLENGKIEGSEISFETRSDDRTYVFKGEIGTDEIRLSWQLAGYPETSREAQRTRMSLRLIRKK